MAKVKALKRAAEETNQIALWNIGAIANFYKRLQMDPLDSAFLALPSLSEFLVLLQEMIERGPFDYRAPEVDKLAPSYECNKRRKGAAERMFLWRILASCFAKHCNKIPYGIIAALTQVALESDYIDPETIRRDIQRHRTVIEADISS